ncbi:MAG TPA: molecular chaperone DnaJ [Sedimenticola sp.]|nr:molecular chaperone DnaJ [Sedimenticola sp.]
MEVAGNLFSDVAHWWLAGLYSLLLLLAVRLGNWRRLLDSEQLNVFLGSCVALILLWQVRAQIDPAWAFHLLGVTTLTLMFGWSLAVAGASIVLLAVTINGSQDWGGFFLNALTLAVLPATLTQFSLVLARSYLPKNFFVYVLVNAFLTAGFVGLVSGYLTSWLLVLSGRFTLLELEQNFIPFFPLMFLPEAILNGWIMTILVLYRPRWVGSFSDVQYINGK